jgi:hypothetical protein
MGEAKGPWSPASRPFSTAPSSVPSVPAGVRADTAGLGASSVALVVTAPHDDGGLPLKHLLVWKKHADPGFGDDWLLAGE